MNPPGSRFCNGCGHNLFPPSQEPIPETPSFDEKLDKFQRYLPRGLTEKILAQKEKIEGERKQVTVMFCDMEGYSAFTEKLDPEEAYAIMDQVYEILIHKVHDYEGTVNEMTGDGIVALFGAPIAMEDAPQRAIRSSLAIHREMAKFSDKIKQENQSILPFKMRIGIHTGPVVVGTLGNNLRVEFKAVGDTVNLASRMEGLANPGTTYVTDETFRVTEGLFRFEALGEREIKGKEEPIHVYRVIAPSTRRTRFDVSAERGLTSFVGRERELELLLDGFERCKEGRGQAFSIVAEAGVGKSRLLYEFRKAVTNENLTFLEGKCLSYSRGVAYYPVIDILKSNFDIREEDGDVEIGQKVNKGIEILKVDEESTIPYLLDLLTIKDSGIDQITTNPETRQKRIIDALTRIVLKGSEIRPLIMAIEDLHWIDTSSEASLKHLLESISGSRIFLIFTYRPEFVHTWGGRSYHSQLNLNRLSNRQSLIMVSHLMGTKELDHALEELILGKTEGVPFFIEEFLKSFKNLQIIEIKDNQYHLAEGIDDLTIPTTIQDVIMARVDSLPEEAKEVLQRGSVIEREFSHKLIKKVMAFQEQELLSHLSILKDSEFLYERGIYPESTYIFKHALTREVVYDSILTKIKKRLHKEIGQVIEEISIGKLEEFYEKLAHHYDHGENWGKAIKYQVKAGMKARKNFAFQAALNYFNRAKQILDKHAPDVTWRVRYDLSLASGQILGEMGQWPLAFQKTQNAVKIARREGSRQQKVEALFASAFSAFWAQLIDDLKAALAELEPFVADDPESLMGAAALQTMVKFISDDIPSALAGEKKVDELIRLVPSSPFLTPASMWRSFYHRWRGDFRKCSEILEPTLPRMKEEAPATVYLQSLFFYGLAMGEQGHYQTAVEILEAGRRHGLKAGEQYTTPKLTNSLGWIYHELCCFDKAIEYNNLALDSIMDLLGPETSNLFEIESHTRINLGENYLMKRNFENALDHLELVHANSQKPEYFFNLWRYRPRCLLGLGELWLQKGDLSKAQFYQDEVTDHGWTAKFPYKKYQVRSGRLQGNIYAAQEKLSVAGTILQQTLKLAEQLGNPTQIWKTHQAMGNLYHKQNKTGQASTEYLKALKIVQGIAEKLTDPELNEGFLRSEPIHEVLAQAEGI